MAVGSYGGGIGRTGQTMDFELNQEQGQFRDSVRRFAERHLSDGALRRAHEPGFPFDVARAMAA